MACLVDTCNFQCKKNKQTIDFQQKNSEQEYHKVMPINSCNKFYPKSYHLDNLKSN